MDVWVIFAYSKANKRFLHQVNQIFDSEAAAKAWINRESEKNKFNYQVHVQYVLTLADALKVFKYDH